MGTKQIAKNTIFLYLRMGFSLIVSLFTVRIILSALGDIDYGIFNVVAGFVAMLGFMNVSLVNGVQRFYNYELGTKGITGLSEVYKSSMLIQVILGLFIVVIIETIGLWYLNCKMVIPSDKLSEANWLMQLTLVSLLMGMIQVPFSAAVIAKERFNVYAYIGILDVLLRLAIAYTLTLLSSNKLIIYGLLLSLTAILDLIIYYFYCRKRLKELFSSCTYNKGLTKSMVKFMSWNTFGSGAYIFRTQGLNLLLNSFFGVVLNAANGIATQISGAVQNFALNLISAFKPQLVQEYAAGNKEKSFSLMILMTKVSFALICILSIPIILKIDFILKLWLGKEVPPFTNSFSCLVLLSVWISCWHTPITQMIHAIGVMGRFQMVTSIIILSTIVIVWISFLLGLGPNWLYYATIITYLINQIAAMVILRQLFPYSIWMYLKNAVLPCVIFALSFAVFPFLYSLYTDNSLLQLIVLFIISGIVAIPLFYLFILNSQEKAQLIIYIKSKLR